jgi:hypothetical protein
MDLIFGGYASKPFPLEKERNKADENAFIFSLTRRKKLN